VLVGSALAFDKGRAGDSICAGIGPCRIWAQIMGVALCAGLVLVGSALAFEGGGWGVWLGLRAAPEILSKTLPDLVVSGRLLSHPLRNVGVWI